MKSLVVYHPPVVSEQVHANLEMVARINIRCHDVVVGPVQENLSQQLYRLPLRDIAVRLDEDAVVLGEEEIKVRL